jgi:hypothetical protein
MPMSSSMVPGIEPGTKRLPDGHLPRYLSAHAGAKTAAVGYDTFVKYVEPDAWLHAAKGQKSYPLYLRETVENFRAEREAQGGAE